MDLLQRIQELHQFLAQDHAEAAVAVAAVDQAADAGVVVSEKLDYGNNCCVFACIYIFYYNLFSRWLS